MRRVPTRASRSGFSVQSLGARCAIVLGLLGVWVYDVCGIVLYQIVCLSVHLFIGLGVVLGGLPVRSSGCPSFRQEVWFSPRGLCPWVWYGGCINKFHVPGEGALVGFHQFQFLCVGHLGRGEMP